MIYLTGVTNDRDEPALIGAGLGLMIQPGNSYHLRVGRFRCWAADNGCFSDKWVEDKHLSWLDALPREGCLFAVAPDVYPDAVGSLERGSLYFELIRSMGFPVAVVAQDGAEHLDYPWDDFDCLFIGGKRTPNPKDEWKVSEAAAGLCRLARRHGKWVHMGRVNSPKRMRRAREMGCHSADGTFLKYRKRKRATDTKGTRPRGAHELVEASAWLAANPHLPLIPFEGVSLPVHRAALDGTPQQVETSDE